MKIGILETGEVSPDLKARHGDYPAMFRELLGTVDPTLEFATVRVVAGEVPEGPRQVDGWIVTGSRHGVYDGLPWIEPLKAFLRACVAERVPVVGVCFGHQILAEALGGRVVKHAGGWVLGVQDYEVAARPEWMRSLPERFAVRALHQDQVVDLPPGATVLARSEACELAALAYGDPDAPDAVGLQPHPEFGSEFMEALIAARAGTVIPVDAAEAGRASLERRVDSRAWAELIVGFLRRAVAARAAA